MNSLGTGLSCVWQKKDVSVSIVYINALSLQRTEVLELRPSAARIRWSRNRIDSSRLWQHIRPCWYYGNTWAFKSYIHKFVITLSFPPCVLYCNVFLKHTWVGENLWLSACWFYWPIYDLRHIGMSEWVRFHAAFSSIHVISLPGPQEKGFTYCNHVGNRTRAFSLTSESFINCATPPPRHIGRSSYITLTLSDIRFVHVTHTTRSNRLTR